MRKIWHIYQEGVGSCAYITAPRNFFTAVYLRYRGYRPLPFNPQVWWFKRGGEK